MDEADGRAPVLPDVLGPNLRIVFCGTAAGTVSARRGAYYAHPQNRFWRTLHEVGLTPWLVPPEDYREVLKWGLGLTDLAKHVFGMDSELPRGVLAADARDALRAKIASVQPRHLAFTSLAAGRAYLGRVENLGEQVERIGSTRIWVLPSPSPAALWNWAAHAHWWTKLAEAAGEPGVAAAPFQNGSSQA